MSRLGTISIDGSDYDLDQLTLGEMEEVENMCPRKRPLPDGQIIEEATPFSELNYGSARVLKALTFVIMRHENADLTLEDVANITVAGLMPPDEEMPVLPPVGEAKETQSHSDHDSSGPRLSAASTAG